MHKLKGFERTYLRGLAHGIKPVVQIGKGGLTDEVIASIREALAARELIKIKFNEHKEEKKELAGQIEEVTDSEMAGMVGNVAIFFKENDDTAKRKVKLLVKDKKSEIKKAR